MASRKIKRFTQSYLFRNIETIFLVFLIITLVAGMTVYFSYGLNKANKEMHSLISTSDNEYLFREMEKLNDNDLLLTEKQKEIGIQPLEFTIYYIRRGDSLNKIASKFGINFDSVVSVNKIRNARSLIVKRPILIPNQIGIYYRVRRSDTMTKIAKRYRRYKVTEEKIQKINDLDSRDLLTGETLFIPGGRLTRNQREKVMGLEYAIPVSGRVVSGVGYRRDPFHGRWNFHPGVDIAAPYGRKVFAGKSGRVKLACWYGGYGKCVIIQHRGGYETRYGHMSRIYVRKGQWVRRNTLIGRVGSTGRSRGPHLHFEVRYKNKIINPFRYHGLNRRMWWR